MKKIVNDEKRSISLTTSNRTNRTNRTATERFQKKKKDRRYSQDELHQQTLSEMRVIQERRKSDIESFEELSRNKIKTEYTICLESGVNHVWSVVYDQEKKISGYYKTGRNGNAKSSFLETLIYEMAIQLGICKYLAPTTLPKLFSPRSMNNFKIPKKLEKNISNEKKNNSDTVRSFFKKNIKPQFNSFRKSNENFKSIISNKDESIQLSFQKALDGMEIKKIYDLNIPLYQYFKSKNTEMKENDIKKFYFNCFLNASLVTFILGTWDGHRKNIILNKDGFRFFDNARSLPHGELIVWGDKIRLSYFTVLVEEDDFYYNLNAENKKLCENFFKKIEKELKDLGHYLNSSRGETLIENVTEEWFQKELVLESLKERINNGKKILEKGNNLNLSDIMFAIFPNYVFFTLLNTIILLDNSEDISDELINKCWKYSISEVGKSYDLLSLIDKIDELGYDPFMILNHSKSHNINQSIKTILEKGKNNYIKNKVNLMKIWFKIGRAHV